jgi:D-alanyl-D-alanine carboxypeptidase (penicillin-binding protein 5/6)
MADEERPVEESAGPVFPRYRSVLAATLVLIFFASAGLTVAYFSNTRTDAPSTQTAAAVEPADPFAEIELTGESAYVLDLATGHVLYSLAPDTQLPLASLTKVPMALAVSEVLSPDATITIPYDTAPPGSAERLAAGEVWRVQDIINFTLIASSNGGADILAAAANAPIHARYPEAPPQSATLWRMNAIAQQLGLSNTYFLNDNGLDISATQAGAYGSARDVAKLFAYAASTSPAVFEGTARNGLLLTSVSGQKTSAFNTDLALESIPGLIMGKTGYTDLAGGNLAVVFDVGPAHPVVAVVLHSTESGRFDDMKKLVAATITAIGQGR